MTRPAPRLTSPPARRKLTTLRLPMDLVDAIDDRAEREGMSRTMLIETALRKYVKRRSTTDEEVFS